ncbi:MAG: hypothetical protein AAF206_01330 [Bacteroidota bacterium]
MLGLLFIYFIGKAFYDLAFDHDKNQWGFAILGVASYYIGSFVGGFLAGGIYLVASGAIVNDSHDLILTLIGIPFGLLSCYLTYRILKKRWERRNQVDMSIIDEIGQGEG